MDFYSTNSTLLYSTLLTLLYSTLLTGISDGRPLSGHYYYHVMSCIYLYIYIFTCIHV